MRLLGIDVLWDPEFRIQLVEREIGGDRAIRSVRVSRLTRHSPYSVYWGRDVPLLPAPRFSKSVGVIHLLVAGQRYKRRLPKRASKGMAIIPAGARISAPAAVLRPRARRVRHCCLVHPLTDWILAPNAASAS